MHSFGQRPMIKDNYTVYHTKLHTITALLFLFTFLYRLFDMFWLLCCYFQGMDGV
ncbi:hypothetical protein EI42_04305 [Thermosporothrix hazakensis]|jgi:hypothetical protein|uniref:Uncharacterized protein n=1 Tax=Thermosporothrix hazakensis TaxID=644383 RepID=A0A326UBS0_THEHA|nr:hypothetical protein EI42_04305 [Thermosporothrix hazakensis]